jgi:hypothetical protein
MDLYKALESEAYLELMKKSGNEYDLNRSLIEKGIRKKMTFTELLCPGNITNNNIH